MKKILVAFCFIFSLLIITSCGVSKADYDKIVEENTVIKNESSTLKAKIEKLEAEIDEIKNGADRISKKIEISFKDKDYRSVVSFFEELKVKHPTAKEVDLNQSKYNDSKQILDDIEKKEKAEKDKLAKEKLAEEKRAEELKKASVNKLKKKQDDVSGITWYYQPYFTHYTNTNLTSLYIGKKGNNVWLRLQMSFKGDNWIFFDTAYLSYDGNTIEIPFDKYDEYKSENDGGYVWEWIDVSPSSTTISFLREFAKSKNAKMRLTGKYEETRALSVNEKKGILDILNAYDTLLGM